jgi:hypothetical protein
MKKNLDSIGFGGEMTDVPKVYGKEEIKYKIKIAPGVLFKNDSFLLEKDVNERSISHKLAEYLQEQFPDYDVDCEYNWQADDLEERSHKKQVVFSREEEVLFYPKTKKEGIKDNNAHTVYPDIIVHRRGHNKNNLLIVEIKKSSNNDEKARGKDKLKLEKYKEKFGYSYTLFLSMPTGKDLKLKSLDMELDDETPK